MKIVFKFNAKSKGIYGGQAKELLTKELMKRKGFTFEIQDNIVIINVIDNDDSDRHEVIHDYSM